MSTIPSEELIKHHPELKAHDVDSVRNYFDGVLEFYQELDKALISLNGSYSYRSCEAKSSILKALSNSLDPQFAGLLSAYANKIADTDSNFKCPLCLVNGVRNGYYCESAYEPNEDSECLALEWCQNNRYNDEPDTKAAFGLVRLECKKRNISNLTWLLDWR